VEPLRLSTGYKDVDRLIEGGVPQGAVVAYSGVGVLDKQEAGLNFISSGLKQNELCLIITTKYTPDQYKKLAETRGIDLGSVVFLDAVSWRMKRVNPKLKSQSEYEINNLSDLNALLSSVMKICNEKEDINRVFFDTPSSLLLYSTPGIEQVYKFIELLIAFMRNSDITMVFSIEENVHEDAVLNTLLFLADGHFQIIRGDNGINLRPKFLIFTEI
jgi:KaiC/GvpD/RAD55 family RecA-like ATPase